MKSIKFHYLSIIETFRELFKGNFLLYFIPGAVLTIIYLWITYTAGNIKDTFLLESDDSWYSWATGTINYGVNGFFGFLGFIGDQIYIFAVITLLSPFNTVLSEKLENKLIGTNHKSSLARFINDIIRMIFIVILAITLEFSCLAVYWFISFIFGLGLIDTLMYFLISAFFFGMSFYDFSLERDEIGVFGTVGFAFSNILSMLLTGSLFLIIYNIPVIGIPISPVITVMISTIVYLYISNKLPKQENALIQNENE